MNQLALLPTEPGLPPVTQSSALTGVTRPILLRRRGVRVAPPRTAVGAPGYLPVRAAAERLGLHPRSVRRLIERGRLRSQRLGRMHFLSATQVDAYRRGRRAKRR